MNEIFIDNDCKVCSAYGDWINKKNNNLKLNDQKNLSENEIMLDKSIYILKLFPKRIRDFFYNIFAKNRHLI